MNCFKPGTPSHHPARGLTVAKDYYLADGDLYFKIDQTIFCIHSYFFTRECPNFRERMAGVECARVHAGTSDQTAIPVKNISAEEFSQFLWVFYDPTYSYSAPAPTWRNILIISSQKEWDFPKVHALALNKLNDLPIPIFDRIALYQTCSVSMQHLVPLYAELCLREEPLTLEEAIKLGYELSVLIFQVRERLLRGARRGANSDDMTARDQVKEIVTTMLNLSEENSSILGLHGKGTQGHLSPKVLSASIFQSNTCAQDKITPKVKGKRKQAPEPPLGEGRHQEMGGDPPKHTSQAVNQAREVVRGVVGTFKGKVRFGAPA